MNYLNLETWLLHSPEFIGAEPLSRATWINLMLWCAEQENGGVIPDSRSWSDRQWQQTCGVTAAEVNSASTLFEFEGDDLHLAFYPIDQQKIMLARRKVARTNGQLGGRPPKKKPTSEPMSVPISEPMSESVKERKGKETIATAKPPRARNPLLNTLAAIDGSKLEQITDLAWGAIGKALKEILGVCPNVSATEIERRAANYHLLFPTAVITPNALAKHWAKCEHSPKGDSKEPVLKYNPF